MTDHAQDERAIFLAALEQPTDREREAYVRGACGGQPELLDRLLKLLSAHQQSAGPLDSPPPGLATSPTFDQPPSERPGTIIGPYKLLEQIGEGGFGVVFMAEQRQPVRRKVALKVLKPGMDTRQVVARFEAERQALALMDHPHIAHVFDGGETASGRPYFVMELVRGTPITDFCDQSQLHVRQRLELFIDVCQAVQHAHQNGIIHRDLKPTNVLVTMHDEKAMVKVIDFGIAKATGTQLTDKTLFTAFAQMMGTPMYMSPEQAAMSGLDVDTRSDIYSLGVLLYELLTGTTPFDKELLRTAPYDEIRRIIRDEEPPKPSTRFTTLGLATATVVANRKSDLQRLRQQCRGELDWVVMKALEKDRNRRYETANGLARDIERYLRDEPVQACPPSSWYRFRKFARRHKAGLATSAMGLCFIILMCGAAGWMVRDQYARRTKLAGQLGLVLAEVAERQAGQQWPQASAAARRAEALVAGGGGDPALQREVQQVLADLNLVQELEKIRLEREGVSPKDEQADEAYAASFRNFGVDVDRLSAGEAAESLMARAPIGVALAAALDDWAHVRNRRRNVPGARALWGLARQIDPDPWRQQVREALAQNDVIALEGLAHSPGLLQQPPATLYLLGTWLCRTKKLEQGIKLLRSAQRHHPGDFWLNHALGTRLNELGSAHRDDALGFYRAAVAIRPQSAWIWYKIGSNLCEKQEWDEGASCLVKSLEFDPKNAWAYNDLGGAQAKQNRLDEAIASFTKAIELVPRFANAHYNLGFALRLQNKIDEAIPCYWMALEIDPKKDNARGNLLNAIRDQKNRDKSIAFFKKASEADPQNALTHFYLGNALWWQGNVNESLAHFEKAVELDPNDKAYYHSLGNNQRRLNKLDEAIASYGKAIELNLKSAWLQYEFGCALRDKDRLGEAIVSWKKAIEIDPNFLRINTKLAWHLATAADPQQRDPQTALVHARKVADAKPDEANHWSNLGVALLRSGDAKTAVQTLEKSDQMWDGGDNYHRFFLAMAYWQVGDMDKARAAYERAVHWMDQNQPDDEELRRFRAEAAELLDKKPEISTPEAASASL